jgi:hypothetical protein
MSPSNRSSFVRPCIRDLAWCSGISIVAWTVLLVCTFTSTSTAQGGDTSPTQLLEALFSPQTSDDQWHSTADSFGRLPVETKIQALFPEIAKGLPGGYTYAAYNCFSPDTDRRVPGWGRYCVAKWLWCKALDCGRNNPEVGKILLELWNHPPSTGGESALLAALDYGSWVPEAEELVRSLFKDSEADSHLREQAALCLLRRFGSKYHAEAVGFALYSQRDIRDVIFKELVEPPHARLSGIDPAVVRMGFWLLFDEVDKNEEAFARDGVLRSQYGAFLVANRLGNYLGEKFTPDYKLSKYHGEPGSEALWTEATENALAWWPKNKGRFAK